MGDEPLAFLAAESAVGLLRESELGTVAGDQVLELLGERAAGPEDQRFERGLRDVEDPRDLLVRAPLHLPEDERFALRLRDPLQGSDEVLDRGSVGVGLERRNIAVELDLPRPGLLLAEALPNQVVRDRDQPVRRLARPLASLQRAQRVDERRLRDVLGVGPVSEDGVDVAVDLRRVGAVELIQVAVRPGSLSRSWPSVVDARKSALSRARTKSLHLNAQVESPARIYPLKPHAVLD